MQIESFPYLVNIKFSSSFWIIGGGGGAVAQSVERATPGEEVPSSILTVAAPFLLVGSVSV